MGNAIATLNLRLLLVNRVQLETPYVVHNDQVIEPVFYNACHVSWLEPTLNAGVTPLKSTELAAANRCLNHASVEGRNAALPAREQ